MMRAAIFIVILLAGKFLRAQDTWMLEIRSSVELRTLKLTNKAEQDSRPLKGATIALYQGSSIVKQVSSDGRGDFSVMVPPNGDFMMVISYPGCNPKKFQISTKEVPDDYDTEGWEPAFPIGGVIMAKPIYSIDYAALQQPMARIYFKQKGKVFDDDADYTDEVLTRLKKIKADEDELIARFLEAVQAGDAALKKPDCPLARMMYEKALKLIPGEQYPTAQLAKVGDCLKELQLKEQALAEKAAKEKQEEEARQKAKKERQAREREEAARVAMEKEAAVARKKGVEERRVIEKQNEQLAHQKREEEERTRKEAEKAAKEAEEDSEDLMAAEKKLKREKAEEAAKQQAAAEKQNQETGEKESRRRAEEEKLVKEQSPGQEQGQKRVQSADRSNPEKSDAKAKKSVQEKRNFVIIPSENSNRSSGRVKSRRSRRAVRHVIGSSQYEQTIAEADEHFKNKEYADAKVLYDKALDLKPLDAHATSRLDEIKKLLSPPSPD